MKKLNRLALTASMFSVLLAVSGCSDKPYHSVLGTDLLKVYSAQEVNDTKYGKYEYSITDGTSKGWRLKTNSKFEIGDHLEIIKKTKTHNPKHNGKRSAVRLTALLNVGI